MCETDGLKLPRQDGYRRVPSSRPRRRKLPGALVCAGLASFGAGLITAGCGAGGSAPAAAAAQRGVTVQVQWPAPVSRKTTAGRSLPISTGSVVVTVTDSGGFVETQTLNKPSGTASYAVATFFGLRPGNLQVQAVAYVGANGAGDELDSTTSTATISSGATGNVSIAFANVPYHSLVVTANGSTTVPIGSTLALVATGYDANGNAISTDTGGKWTSSDSKVATVSSSGVVTAISPGKVTITFTDGALSSSIGLTSEGLVSVSLTPGATQTIARGGSVTFQVSGVETDGAAAKPAPTGAWTSSNTAVATVNASGKVTGVAPGSATITFDDTAAGLSASVKVTVSGLISITIVPSGPITLVQFATLALSSSGTDATGEPVLSPPGTWSSSKPAVATVSSTGLVTALTAGTTVITFTDSTYGDTATVTITVPVTPFASIQLTPGATQTILQAQTVSFVATAYDSKGHVLAVSPPGKWSSSNTAIATVSSSGVVSGLLPGSVTITFTDSTYGKTASVSVVVQGGGSKVTVQ